MKFLFGLKFSLFDLIVQAVAITLIWSTDSYWWLLLVFVGGAVSKHMENKLAIRAIMEERQRGYGQ